MKCEMKRVINANYIQYETLNSLLVNKPYFNNKKAIVIYIDMYSICKSLYNNNVTIEDYSIITSSIINMVAHYRSYFENKFKLPTAFFIIYSDNCPNINSLLVKNYNSKYTDIIKANDKVYETIQLNNEMLDLICKYLPDIYFIKRQQTEVSTIIYDLMCKKDINNLFAHIIISKDIYTWQLVNPKSSTIILRPKKEKIISNGKEITHDISLCIDKENVLYYYTINKKLKNIPNVSPDLLSIILAGTNLPERNIKSMVTTNKFILALETSINEKKILNSYNSSAIYVYNTLFDILKNDISPIIAEARFKAIDIIYQQQLFMNTLESNFDKELVNLNDPNGVQEINNKYFKDNPLDLNRL